MLPPSGDLAVIIPARNESDRIGATVKAAAGLPGVDIVMVVDDGSADGTAAEAQNAGASVMRHARNRGKGAAMETGAEAVRLLEAGQDRASPHYLLFLDGDLAETAREAGPLAGPVRAGRADMTIAVVRNPVRRGGPGLGVGPSRSRVLRAPGGGPAPPPNRPPRLPRAAL